MPLPNNHIDPIARRQHRKFVEHIVVKPRTRRYTLYPQSWGRKTKPGFDKFEYIPVVSSDATAADQSVARVLRRSARVGGDVDDDHFHRITQ